MRITRQVIPREQSQQHILPPPYIPCSQPGMRHIAAYVPIRLLSYQDGRNRLIQPDSHLFGGVERVSQCRGGEPLAPELAAETI